MILPFYFDLKNISPTENLTLAIWEWRLERAAELGAMSILSKTYKEFSNPFKRDW